MNFFNSNYRLKNVELKALFSPPLMKFPGSFSILWKARSVKNVGLTKKLREFTLEFSIKNLGRFWRPVAKSKKKCCDPNIRGNQTGAYRSILFTQLQIVENCIPAFILDEFRKNIVWTIITMATQLILIPSTLFPSSHSFRFHNVLNNLYWSFSCSLINLIKTLYTLS